MKRLLSIILAITFVCSVLTGCEMENEEIIEPTSELTIYLRENDNVIYSNAITMYKYHYKDVKINTVDLADLSWTEFNERLKSEIQAGKGPDLIFDCGKIFTDINKGVASGAFYDINKLIKNDKDFKLSDYNKVALDAGVFEGKRYIMPISIRVPFLMTTQSIVDEVGIDIKKCDNIVGIGEEINRLIQEKPDRYIFKEKNTFYEYINFFGMDIVDYKNNKINIDEELFRQAVDFSKSLYKAEKNIPKRSDFSTNFDAYLDLIQKNEVFEYLWSSRIDVCIGNVGALLSKDEKPILLPIKTADNKIQSFVNCDVAITNNSKNKLNAYNFIKVMLSDSVQTNVITPMDIPVSNESQKKRFDYINNSLGDGQTLNLDNEVVFMKKPSEKFINDFKSTIKNVERCTYRDAALEFLIYNLYDYYEDKKSFEECFNEAKSQLEIYISE